MRKKIIAVILTLCLAVSVFSLVPAAAEIVSNVGKTPAENKDILFSNDFEDEYTDVTAEINPNRLAASPESPFGEMSSNLFDGISATKFCTNFTPGTGVTVTFTMYRPTYVAAYTFTSANDAPLRDPHVWRLFGSNNNSSWTELDSFSGEGFSSRMQTKEYEVRNPGTYLYYKLSIDATIGSHTGSSDGLFQLAEFRMFKNSTEALSENYTSLLSGNIKSITADHQNNQTEIPANMVDGNAETKFLANHTGAGDTCNITIELENPVTIDAYAITSANDEPGRDPSRWILEGSNDKVGWERLDHVGKTDFSERFQRKIFRNFASGAYKYYKFCISATKKSDGRESGGGDYMQIAEIDLLKSTDHNPFIANKAYGSSTGLASGLTADFSLDGYNEKGKGLLVRGIRNVSGQSSAYVVVNDGLNIPVSEKTNLLYYVRPGIAYSESHPNQNFALDILFSDGTRLKDMNPHDQNGNIMTPLGQGECKAMITGEWNMIYTNLGEVALGKTISAILLGYEKNEGVTDELYAAFDNIQIYNDLTNPKSLVEYTNITRGTQITTGGLSRGFTYPAVKAPNGFVTVSPATTFGDRFIYDYYKTELTHFTTAHQASVHLLDYGEFQFMPNTSMNINSVNYDSVSVYNRKSSFSHENEIDQANYYSVVFDKGTPASQVKTEMTATDHGGAFRFTFPSGSAERNIIFDGCNTEVGNSGSMSFNSNTFSAIVNNYHPTWNNGASLMYVYGTFSSAPQRTKTFDNGKPTGMVSFDSSVQTVELKFATSYISVEQAQKNFSLELTSDFDTVARVTGDLWNELLGTVEIEGANYDQLSSIYTGMYRMYSYPTNYSENTGTAANPVIQYKSPYSQNVTNGQLYTSNGFWDTYHTTFPAYALLTPTRAGQFLDGILQHYKDNGSIARWLNPAGVASMVGTHSDAIFADSAIKGVKFDYQTAFDTIIQNATSTRATNSSGRLDQANSWYIGHTTNVIGTSVSWHLEDCINDYAAGIMAKLLGKTDYSKWLINHSLTYKNLFEPQSGFFVTRGADGNFFKTGADVDPYLWDPNGLGIIESNAWGMAFYASFDPEGMASLYGGKQGLAQKLDAMMAANPNCTSAIGTQHEMLEGRECKMGQYWHSNQPAHSTLYMYNYADQPYKTQKYTRQVLRNLYVGGLNGQGYLGDEDNGEQGAWYLLTSLGFYPASIGSGKYAITSPAFRKVTLHLESGDVVINAQNNSNENVYIQSMTVDGKQWNSPEITHDALIHAKNINFVMGNAPSAWGTGDGVITSSLTVDSNVVNMETFAFDGAAAPTCSNVGALFDKNLSSAVLSGATNDIIVLYNNPKVVKMVTVTNRNGKSPSAATVYASNDQSNWVTLRQTGLSFMEPTQLVPIALENNTAYNFYKITLTGSCELNEVEFMGYPGETPYNSESLNKLVKTADVLDEDTSVLGNAGVRQAYSAAKRGVANNELSDYNATVLYNALDTALANAVSSEQYQKGKNIAAAQKGDVDVDGQVTAADALKVLRNTVDLETLKDYEIELGRVATTGSELSVLDALKILQYSVNLIDHFGNSTILMDMDSIDSTYRGEYLTNIITDRNEKTQGTGAMRMMMKQPAGQPADVGGMAIVSLKQPMNIEKFKKFTMDVYFPINLEGNSYVQVNFATEGEDGFNYICHVDDYKAGWHTLTFDEQHLTFVKPEITTASQINTIRLTWFNVSKISTPQYVILDNLQGWYN